MASRDTALGCSTLAVLWITGLCVANAPAARAQAEADWNGRDDKGVQVASGTYPVRIDAGAQQATTFLTLIR